MKEEKIHELKLHERIYFEDCTIQRVAGGWTYCFSAYSINQLSCVFVPFNNEFKNNTKNNENT